MSGLSAASVERLTELEAKPELAPVERGELLSMTHSKPTPEERARVERLLAPAPAEGKPGGAYERGLELGRAAGSARNTARY